MIDFVGLDTAQPNLSEGVSSSGRLLSYGNKNGVTVYLTYADGKPTGQADHTGRQVIWYKYNADGRLCSVRDIAGRKVEYYYQGGNLTRFVDVMGNESLYSYDDKGRLTAKWDAAGRRSSVAYNSTGEVISDTDAAGNSMYFDYGYNSGTKESYSKVTFASGKVQETWFDKDAKKTRVDINGKTVEKITRGNREEMDTDAAGNQTYRKYDEWDNLIQEVYPDGATVNYEYQPGMANVTRKVDERGIVTRYEYDGNGNLTRMVEAGRVTEYSYDAYGNQTSIKTGGDEVTDEAITSMSYDENGNMISLTDLEGNSTRFTYDIMGNMLTKTDAAGKLWQYAYDAAGHLTSSTDPLGNTTRMYYDAVGNMIRVVDAEGHETVNEYGPTNKLVQTTDALGNSAVYSYNADGKPIKQVDREGKQIAYKYDLDGRLIKAIDGNGNEITNEYGNAPAGGSCSACAAAGAAGNPVKVTYPTSAKTFAYDKRGRKVEEDDILASGTAYATQFAYDATGNLTQTTDKNGKITRNGYDTLNRLATVTDAGSGITSYSYDARNNMIALKDAKGQVSRFEYDRNKRLVKETRPMGQETRYEYNATGLLMRKIDAKGQKIEYGYDDAGRLTDTSYYSTTSNPVKTVTYTYDSIGKLTGYNDGITSATYVYDDLHRKVSETVKYGSFSLSYSYTYYKNGLKKGFTGPDGITYGYTYDANNQLVNVVIPSQGIISYNSYAWDEPSNITLPGGNTVAYAYDPLMRLKSILAKDPAQSQLMSYLYSYDQMDNVVAKNTQDGNYLYSYDLLYRLKNAANSGFNNEIYSYDTVGNRLSANDTIGSWVYNANNQLTSYPGATFAYDANGNMTQQTINGVTRNYTYDIENRLIRIENADGSVVAEYYYDPFGRRLWKDVGGVRTNFFYANEGLIGEYNAMGSEIRTYGYKPDSTWTTDPLFLEENNKYYFYRNDHLGTPILLTDSSGAVVWAANYQTFGQIANTTGTIRQPLRFPGQYYDQETGLHYNWNRYYDPKTGRYLTSDPIRLEGGINFYNYVLNNPQNISDPNGLDWHHKSGKWQDCGNGCKIRIDTTTINGVSSRHLEWKCSNGSSGQMGENGADSHGQNWKDAPKSILDCALKYGFNPYPQPQPQPMPKCIEVPKWVKIGCILTLIFVCVPAY